MTHRFAPHALCTALVVLFAGCATLRPQADPTIQAAGAPDPCSHRFADVQAAAYDDTARDAARAWLSCCAVQGDRPDPDLGGRLALGLSGGQRSDRFDPDAVVAWFFDRGQLKAFPASGSDLERYRALLSDQALAARAQGDLEMARAIDARAAKLAKLDEILDAVEQ